MQTAPRYASDIAFTPTVKTIQQLLQKLGYNVGTPDGKMGTRTASAIRLFQLQSGMRVTGDVTPEYLQRLEQERSDGAKAGRRDSPLKAVN